MPATQRAFFLDLSLGLNYVTNIKNDETWIKIDLDMFAFWQDYTSH